MAEGKAEENRDLECRTLWEEKMEPEVLPRWFSRAANKENEAIPLWYEERRGNNEACFCLVATFLFRNF